VSNKPAHRVGAHKANRKEAYYVRVSLPDGTNQFFPATDFIGKAMPFDKPKETCAMRVYPDVVCFSLLHLTKKASAEMADRVIEMPHGPLARLARRSQMYSPLAVGELVVEHNEAETRLTYEVDETGVATIEAPDDETVFELDRRGERVSVYVHSAVVGRTVAIGFIGHVGKPGGNETVRRCAAKILNAALGLPEFQLLAGMETVVVPAMIGGGMSRATRTDPHTIELPIQLFTEELAPVGAGTVAVAFDLEHASYATDRLLFRLTPSATIAEKFDPYRGVCELAVAQYLPVVLEPEQIKSIIFDIVLGEVEAGTVERLDEALRNMPGFDLTPSQLRAVARPGQDAPLPA
jgi:hypothetical protein